MSEQPGRIHRHNYEDKFSIMPHHIVENEEITWLAKCILWYLLSRPLNWIVYRAQISKVYKGTKRGNGKDAVDAAFNELMEFRFIIYTAKDDITGRFIHRYDIYPEPHTETIDFKEKILKPVKQEMGSASNGSNYPQTRKYSSTIKDKENNNSSFSKPKKKTPEPVSQKPAAAVVVFSCLKELKLSEAFKGRLTRELDESKANILVKRIMRWKDRKSDLIACRTILKEWDDWGDNLTNEEIGKKEAVEEALLTQKDDKKRERAKDLQKRAPWLEITCSDHHISRENLKTGFDVIMAYRDEGFDEYINNLEKITQNEECVIG